jgi:hypothetical protein
MSNVYDTATGQYLLIPQGARLVGAYNSRGGYGQNGEMDKWIKEQRGSKTKGSGSRSRKRKSDPSATYANAIPLQSSKPGKTDRDFASPISRVGILTTSPFGAAPVPSGLIRSNKVYSGRSKHKVPNKVQNENGHPVP